MAQLLWDIWLGDLVLAFTTTAVDERDLVGLGISTYTTAQTTGHAHEVRVVQVIIRPIKASPPCPETTWRLTHLQIGIQDNSIDAIVSAVEDPGIMSGELIHHVEALPPLVWSEHTESGLSCQLPRRGHVFWAKSQTTRSPLRVRLMLSWQRNFSRRPRKPAQ